MLEWSAFQGIFFFLPLSVPEPDLSGVFTLHRMDRYQVGSWSPLVHSAGVMCFHATGRWYSEKIEHPSWPINKYYLNTILIFPLLKKKKRKPSWCLLFDVSWKGAESCRYFLLCDGSELECWQLWSISKRLVIVQISSASEILSFFGKLEFNASRCDVRLESLRRLGWKFLPSSDPISFHPLWYYRNWISGLMR